MHISVSKGFALAALALVSVHQSEASLQANFETVGSRQLTSGGMFRTWVVHTAVRNWAKDNLPDSELFGVGSAKLHAHEVWETLASMVVEALYVHCFADARTPEQAAKLVAYGAFTHKLVAEAWHALGLDQYFGDDVKDNYEKFGYGFVQAVLAEQLQETLRGLNVPHA